MHSFKTLMRISHELVLNALNMTIVKMRYLTKGIRVHMYFSYPCLEHLVSEQLRVDLSLHSKEEKTDNTRVGPGVCADGT